MTRTLGERMATAHRLKVEPPFYAAILEGRKTFEIRFNDRGFALYDVLELCEWDPDARRFTGRELRRQVGYMTDYAQQPGYVVMALELLA